MTGAPGPGPHPAVDVLADLDADALEGADATAVRAHVEGCAECADALAALTRVRGELAGLADPALPADVATALDVRLSSLRLAPVSVPGEVHPLRPARRRRWPVSLPGTAAAAVTTLFVAAIGVGVVTSGGDSADEDSSTAGVAGDTSGGGGVADAPMAAGAEPLRLTSGRDYTAATVATLVSGVADTRMESQTAAAPPVPAPLQRLQDPAALQSCLTDLGDGTPVTPLTLDYASYEGRPALLVVVAAGTAQADVWVVGPDCRQGNADLRYFVTVPRAGG